VDISGSHVLVVDNDPDVCTHLCDYLGRNDLQVTALQTGERVLDYIASEAVDLLLMETRLPGEDGFRLASLVRATSSMPIVVLSERSDVVDRVMGLELGADDYVTKPFASRELLARIRAVLRRAQRASVPSRDDGIRAYRFEGWEFNMRLARLKAPDGTTRSISRGESGLLRAFLASPQRVLTREQLLDLTRVNGAEVYDRAVDVQVARLRRRIEQEPARPRFIKTERGTGYYFDASVSVVH
jgi:DNA-binding response OmpR family regulator